MDLSVVQYHSENISKTEYTYHSKLRTDFIKTEHFWNVKLTSFEDKYIICLMPLLPIFSCLLKCRKKMRDWIPLRLPPKRFKTMWTYSRVLTRVKNSGASVHTVLCVSHIGWVTSSWWLHLRMMTINIDQILICYLIIYVSIEYFLTLHQLCFRSVSDWRLRWMCLWKE